MPRCPDLGLPSWARCWFWQLACHFQTGFGVWEAQGNKLSRRSQNWQMMELKVQNSSKGITSAGGARRSPPVLFPPQLFQYDYWLSSICAQQQTFGSNLLTWKSDFIILARMPASMGLLERPLLIIRWNCNSILESHVEEDVPCARSTTCWDPETLQRFCKKNILINKINSKLLIKVKFDILENDLLSC